LTFSFDPICTKPGLIVLRAELTGSTGSGVWQLALDTGATTTLINVAMLVAIGYDPALSADRVQVRRHFRDMPTNRQLDSRSVQPFAF